MVRGKPEADSLHGQNTPSSLGARALAIVDKSTRWEIEIISQTHHTQERTTFLTSEISGPSYWPGHEAATLSGPKQR